MVGGGGLWRRMFFVFKLVVVAAAAYVIVQYAGEYGIVDTLLLVEPAALLQSLFFSVVGFICLTLMLRALSDNMLPVADCVMIEVYTMMLNLGIASSLFSLPKIAFIRERLGDTRKSTALFLLQSVSGIASRAIVFAVASISLFNLTRESGYVMVLTLVFAAVLYAVARRRRHEIKKHRLLQMVNPGKAVQVLLLGVLMAVSTSASYYVLLNGLGETDAGFMQTVFSDQTSYLSGFFSPLPAGLGVREVAFTESAALFNIDRGKSFTASILSRAVMILAEIATATAFLFYSRFLHIARRP